MTSGLIIDDLRTTNDLYNPVIDHPYSGYHFITNSLHALANGMRGHQILCNPHPSLLMCQFVESLKRIFDVFPSNQLLPKFF